MSEQALPPELETAFKTCRETLALRPKDPLALRLLAHLQGVIGQFDEAFATVQKALAADPLSPDAHMTHAFLLHQTHKDLAAIEAIKEAIALRPGHAEAYHNLGDLLAATGQSDAAIAAYGSALAIAPNSPAVLNNLGNLYKATGKLKEAQDTYIRAIGIAPTMPELYNNLGLVLQQTRPDPNDAAKCFQKALELRPDYPDAMNNLGNLHRELGLNEEARALFKKVLEITPNNPEAWNNLGLVLLHVDCAFQESREVFEKALALRPDYPEALNNLAVVLRLLGDHETSFALFKKALDLRPNYTAALNNLGNVLKDTGRYEESIAAYHQGIALKPDDTETHNNLAMALLASGDYEKGWKEYEWRWRTKHLAAATRTYSEPRWQGESEANKTVFIYAEQGFGDTLQFCRYASLVAAKGLNVILEAQAPLVRLLQTLKGPSRIVESGETPPAFDYQIPMLSLPAVFGTTLQTIPAQDTYLRPDPDDVLRWAERLGPRDPTQKRIGLVWAGSSRKHSPDLIATDQRRSLPVEKLGPLMNCGNIHFISLQKDGPSAPEDFAIDSKLIAESRDFADTAALIENLDLVISVDTAVAHLAAAIGKPVWMLNRYDSCWRWQRDRDSTPWYPSMRIFHQKSWGAWSEVLERVKTDLLTFSKA